MNKCDCKTQNCKHNVYIQPSRGIPLQKRTTYIRSNVPIQYESEQKLSYKNHSIQCNAPISSGKNCLGDSLKFGLRHPFETTQHFCYQNWKTPNKLVIKKPRDCVDLLGRGSIHLSTTQQTEFQRKMIIQTSIIIIKY